MGTVHVVATPIGNLEDISLRALRSLAEADVILAEDTRRTRILLQHHDIATRPLSLGTHNEKSRSEEVLARLREGASIALVSDAGTPLISDPGGYFVAAAIEDGHRVEAIPGASAVMAALTSSGLRVQPFTFVGFLPRKRGARMKLLASHSARVETLVIFESPRRVASTLAELAEVFGEDRRACAARELTKLHEEVARGPLGELAERFAEGGRGEFTLVVEGAEEGTEAMRADSLSNEQVDDEIAALLAEGRRPREIAAGLAPRCGLPRRALYGRVVALKDGAKPSLSVETSAETSVRTSAETPAEPQPIADRGGDDPGEASSH